MAPISRKILSTVVVTLFLTCLLLWWADLLAIGTALENVAEVELKGLSTKPLAEENNTADSFADDAVAEPVSFVPSCEETSLNGTLPSSCLYSEFSNDGVTFSYYLRILHPAPLPTTLSYSVIAVLPGMFTVSGIAMSNSSNQIDFLLPLKHPGNYSVFVHKVVGKKNKLVSGSPLHLSIPEGDHKVMSPQRPLHQMLSSLPPCHSLNRDALVAWPSDWLGPDFVHDAIRGDDIRDIAMRTGWSMVSPDKCWLKTFTPQTLQKVSWEANRTILVLGSSRERGIFLTLVDMMLRADEKSRFAESELAKCWGRSSVQLNLLKVVYQDARPNFGDVDERMGTVTCHGANIAFQSGYLQNITQVASRLFQEETTVKVVVFNSACFVSELVDHQDDTSSPIPCMVKAKLGLSGIPSSWDGTIYVTNGFIRADPIFMTDQQRLNYLKGLKIFNNFLNDTRIILLDLSWAQDMKLYAEQVGIVHGSTHHHRFCNVGDMRVCGNVSEALANLVIGRTIEEGNLAEGLATLPVVASAKRRVTFCSDCPATMLPFHIKVESDLECNIGKMPEKKVRPMWVANACPEACLRTKPVGLEDTQSGPIDVRICTNNSSTD